MLLLAFSRILPVSIHRKKLLSPAFQSNDEAKTDTNITLVSKPQLQSNVPDYLYKKQLLEGVRMMLSCFDLFYLLQKKIILPSTELILHQHELK